MVEVEVAICVPCSSHHVSASTGGFQLDEAVACRRSFSTHAAPQAFACCHVVATVLDIIESSESGDLVEREAESRVVVTFGIQLLVALVVVDFLVAKI